MLWCATCNNAQRLRASLGHTVAGLDAWGLQALSVASLQCRVRCNPPVPTRVAAPAHQNTIQKAQSSQLTQSLCLMLHDQDQLPLGKSCHSKYFLDILQMGELRRGTKPVIWSGGRKGGLSSHFSTATISSICPPVSSQCQAPACKVLHVLV